MWELWHRVILCDQGVLTRSLSRSKKIVTIAGRLGGGELCFRSGRYMYLEVEHSACSVPVSNAGVPGVCADMKELVC